MKNVCVHVRTCTCGPGVIFEYHSSGTIHLILWARDWPWFTKYWSMLAGQQTQAICLFPPPQCLGYKHEPPCSSILCACAISIREGGPSTGTESGSEAMLDSQTLNWRKTDFIILNKKERRGRKGVLRGKEREIKKGRGEEEREKECLNVSVTEPTEEICKIGKEILFSLGDF